MTKIAILLGTLTLTSASFAAGKGGGHISDLMFPALNFLLLFGFLAFKLKKPVSNMFVEKANSIQDLFNVAEEKDKEAQIKLDMYERKLSNVASEATKILSDAKEDGIALEKNAIKENDDMILRIKNDGSAKVETERKNLIKEINERLVNEVISTAKNVVGSDENLKKKATNNLMSKI